LNPPKPEYSFARERAQAVGRDASGGFWVYDKNVLTRILRVTLELTAAQKDTLESFFDDTLKGCLNTFTYVDHLSGGIGYAGVTHSSCRLKEPTLAWAKTRGGLYRAELEFILVDNPD
jgi:hypothetical protein